MPDTALFLLQLAVIVALSRAAGVVFRRIGQPMVVGEMAAGIALGPSLFGLFAPAAYHALFPPQSLGFLNAFSQAGLVVFIFLTGVRVDFAELRRQSRVAAFISNVSVAVPFLAGVLLATYLYPKYGRGDFWAFSLFLGAALSVTAFPVLARILAERNLLHTSLGAIAIACAAFDDIVAWLLLAGILSYIHATSAARPLWLIVLLLCVYAVVIAALARALGAWAKRDTAAARSSVAVPFFLALALLAGAAGDWIGIHSLSAAFLAGLAVPRTFRDELVSKLEPFVLTLPIPVFFALTGIRTEFRLSSAPYLWLDLLLVLFAAIGAKWGGAMMGARIQGLPWRDASRLGLLVNTRGLVELVILTVGLDNGILTPPLFSILVLMALITTFMTTPLMDLAAPPALATTGRNAA